MLKIAENHFVNGNKVKPPYPDNHERLIVGMGCFWGAERMFWQLEGVYSTSVGYSAGKTTDPTYKEVCSGTTGHSEVVLVIYDTEIINLSALLAIFWEGHDPTQYMRQGNDIGTQFRIGAESVDTQPVRIINVKNKLAIFIILNLIANVQRILSFKTIKCEENVRFLCFA